MRRRQPRPWHRTATCSLVLAVAATLAMSACAPAADPAAVSGLEASADDPAALSDFEQELADIVGDPATRRPAFALTLDVPGEWISQGILENRGSVLSFVATEGGPRAVVESGWPRTYTVFAPIDGTWQPTFDWIDDSLDLTGGDGGTGPASSYIALNNEVLAVGPRGNRPVDEPWAIVVSAGAAVAPRAHEGTGVVTIRKAAVGNGAVMAIGRRNGRATVWVSTDGIEWSQVALPFEGSYRLDLKDLIFANGRWIVVGKHTAAESDPQQLVVLTTEDGRRWQQATLEPPADGVEPVLRVVLGHDGSNVQVLAHGGSRRNESYFDRVTMINDVVTWTSTGGTTWGPPVPVATGTIVSILDQPTFGATVLPGKTRHLSNSHNCFQTGHPCRSGVRTLWVAHEGMWSPLVPPDGLVPQSAAIIDDVLYVAGKEGGHTAVYQWSPEAGDQLPFASPSDSAPPLTTLPPAPRGPLERGIVYAFSQYPWQSGGAAFDCVHLDDRTWGLDALAPGAIDVIRESGAGADGQLFGTIELVDSDRIELAVPGHGPVVYLKPQATGGGWGDCSGGSL